MTLPAPLLPAQPILILGGFLISPSAYSPMAAVLLQRALPECHVISAGLSPPVGVGADPRAVDRFATEARAAGSLDHPNIVRVYESGESPAGMFIAMEWVDGPTLRAVMDGGLVPLMSFSHSSWA